jgi:hypothetical protein
MFELRPVHPEMLAYLLSHADEYTAKADALQVPEFSDGLRDELRLILNDPGALRLVEAVSRLSRFNDAADLEAMRKAVSRLLRAKGIKQPKGKRANHGLVKLVETITPILLFYGVPLATSERSMLVSALRLIASEVGVCGDPRDELRRLRRHKSQIEGDGYRVLLEAFANGIEPD